MFNEVNEVKTMESSHPSPCVIQTMFFQLLKKTMESNVELPLKINSCDKYNRFVKWCTTSKDKTFFEKYSNQGVLYYIIKKDAALN